jgi:hypothetical protein
VEKADFQANDSNRNHVPPSIGNPGMLAIASHATHGSIQQAPSRKSDHGTASAMKFHA